MASRGKLIVLEGIDGSGKRTQLDLLAAELARRGITHTSLSFPNYDSSFGRLVARFLNGEFGALEDVDPHFSALLYAGDRFESRPALEAALAGAQVILADRYVGSNLAHQTARVPRDQQDEFLAWLKHVEYGIYGLPVEDLVIHLRLPATMAHDLVARKSPRGYTALRRDLQEADLRHLGQAAAVYDRLAQQPNWVTIECAAAGHDSLRSPEQIAAEVLQAAERVLVAGSFAARRKG